MTRPLACLAMLAGLILAVAPGALAQQVTMNPGLATQLRYFHMGVVGGRIQLISPFSGRKLESKHGGQDRRESLQVVLKGPETTVNYEHTTPDWHISVDVIEGRQVLVHREPKDNAAVVPLVFEQPASGVLTLSLGVGEEARVYHAKSIWHLLLAEPDVCGSELLPLLQLIRPGWKLIEAAEAVESLLFDSVRSQHAPQRDRWVALVSELASPRYSRRSAADRKLRGLGREVLPFLVSLDRRQLDSEQRHRIAGIVRDLSARAAADLPTAMAGSPRVYGATGDQPADTPDRVATWLINDPGVWCQLLRSDDEARRLVAAGQLSQLLGEPIAFDPAAELPLRQKQIERLQSQVERIGADAEHRPPFQRGD